MATNGNAGQNNFELAVMNEVNTVVNMRVPIHVITYIINYLVICNK